MGATSFLTDKQRSAVFPLDAEGNHLYSPWGKFGATYFVPDEADRERIARLIAASRRPLNWIMPCYSLTRLCATFMRLDLAIHLIFVLAGLLIFDHRRWLRKLTMNLPVAIPRRPLTVAFRAVAKEASAAKVWAIQIAAIGAIALVRRAFCGHLVIWPLAYFDLGIVLLFSVVIVAICGVMLFARDY